MNSNTKKSLHIRDPLGNNSCISFEIQTELKSIPVEWILHAHEPHIPLVVENALHYQSLLRIMNSPELCLRSPVQLHGQEKPLTNTDTIALTQQHTTLELIPNTQQGPGLPEANTLRQWHQQLYQSSRPLIDPAITRMLDLKKRPFIACNGECIDTFSQLTQSFAQCLTPSTQNMLLFRVAQAIHATPFENISRLNGSTPFRNGATMWLVMDQGDGGICAEKTAALLFICHILDIKPIHVAGSKHPLDDDIDHQLDDWIRHRNRTPPWIEHHILLIPLHDEQWLVDVTGGNAPLVFLNRDDAAPFMEQGLFARMAYRHETLQLTPLDEPVGDALLLLSEFQTPDVTWDLVITQKLGLLINNQHHIGLFPDWGGSRSAAYQTHYAALAQQAGWPAPHFLSLSELDTVLDTISLIDSLSQAVINLRHAHLPPWYTGSFTIVYQPLPGLVQRRLQLVSSDVTQSTSVPA
ncbi:MAG: hypothetical protein HQL54_09425 [Magnetococcales bacterium]|nr:hypothetical protein [Magnetococcales bacterium]